METWITQRYRRVRTEGTLSVGIYCEFLICPKPSFKKTEQASPWYLVKVAHQTSSYCRLFLNFWISVCRTMINIEMRKLRLITNNPVTLFMFGWYVWLVIWLDWVPFLPLWIYQEATAILFTCNYTITDIWTMKAGYFVCTPLFIQIKAETSKNQQRLSSTRRHLIRKRLLQMYKIKWLSPGDSLALIEYVQIHTANKCFFLKRLPLRQKKKYITWSESN